MEKILKNWQVSQEGPGASRYSLDCGIAMFLAMFFQQKGRVLDISVDDAASKVFKSPNDWGEVRDILLLGNIYRMSLQYVQGEDEGITLDRIRTEIDAKRPLGALVLYREFVGRMSKFGGGHWLAVMGYVTDDNDPDDKVTHVVVTDSNWWGPQQEKGHNWPVPVDQFLKSQRPDYKYFSRPKMGVILK